MIKIRRNFAIPLRLPSQESTDDLKRALDAFLNNIPKVYDVPSEADAVLAPLRKKIELLVYNRSMFSSGKPFDSDILIDGANDYLINFLALVESSEIAFNSCGGKSGFFNPKDSTIAVNWGWEESLRKGKVIRAFDCDFEKFSVAWLLAACYSRKASELQEFKEKTILYQKSAGIYEWIDDNCAGNALWGSSDLSKSSLLWCREILIAEGAICTFFNGFFKGLSPNSLKKLAQGASDLLQGVINGQGLDSLVRQGLITSGILSYMKHSWYCMRAEAQWFASQADNLDGKYGDEISRLNLAFEICDQSRKQNYKNHEIDTWRSDLLERICNRIADAVKDNDRIYFLPVPKHHDLPVIESKVLGQVGLFELTIPSSEDFFNFKDLKSLTATGDFCGLDVQRLFGGDIPALNFEVKSFGDDFELQTRIYELKKMGFSYDDAKSALEKNGNDIDLAIDHLSKNLSTSNGINERDISPPSYLHSLIHEKGGNEDISCEQKSDENQPPEFVEDETDGSSTIITKPPLSMKLKRIFSFGLLNSSKNGVANNDRVRKIFNIEDNREKKGTVEKHRAENFVLNTTIAQEFNRGNAPPYVSNLDSESIHRESGFDDVVLTKDDEMIYKAKENQKQLGVIIPNPNLVTKLTEMGISREAAEISLISTKNDFSSALGCLTLTNGTSSEAHRNKQQSTNDVNIHAQIKQIVAMGFTESKAKLALSKSNNDTELAIEFLLSPS